MKLGKISKYSRNLSKMQTYI